MRFSFQRTHAVVLLLLASSNAILVAMIFYFAIPHIEIRKSAADASAIVNKIIQTSTPELVAYWNIRLDTNSRSINAFKTRDAKDTNILTDFLSRSSSVRLTQALSPDEISAMLNNTVSCGTKPFFTSQIIGIPLIAASELKVVNNFESYVCLIPVLNSSQILVGQLIMVWQNQPSKIIIDSELAQAKNIMLK